MEQNADNSTPVTPVVDNKQKSGNGLKITTVIACIVAVCGIGFGVYGMMQSLQKENQISDLQAQVKVNDEKEIREYEASKLRFKKRHGKKEKMELSKEEMRELERLEKQEGKSKLDDN